MDTVMLFNATGRQGATIANRLLGKDYQIVSPVRSEKKLVDLKHKGINAFLSDFSTENLLPQLKQADRVILQIPAQVSPSLMITLSENIITAIKEVGNPPTIFVISSTVPEDFTGKNSPDARLKMKNFALNQLPESIILSATEYLENFSTSYRQAIEQDGIIPQTIPADLPVNYLSWNDLAIYVEAFNQVSIN